MKNNIYLKDFLEAIKYQIGDGFKFLWDCYGDEAYGLNWQRGQWNNYKLDWASAGIVYDSKTQTVYEVSVWDDFSQKVYRWINPKYLNLVKKEYKSRGLNYKIAYDKVKYEELTPTRILNRIKQLQKRKYDE